MKIINYLQFIGKSQSRGFSQAQNFSQKLFFCHSTRGKIQALQSTYLSEPSASQIASSLLKQDHSLISPKQNLFKSREAIQEAERLINHPDYIVKAEEMMRMYKLMHSDEIDQLLKEKLEERFNENAKRIDAKFYADPELDAYIEAHQGKVENIEDFDICNLAHRARSGQLDIETSKKIFQILDDEIDALNQLVLEENKSDLTGYEGVRNFVKKTDILDDNILK
ncbi:hypothetical protein [Rhabdochlamydiaceae symbiont of Dictyostelium giganteum]|uniref:hypothetical protein n=1 Tax=Rhabdochlamydiaceae symbiont of Dictyostelium giganteum TaxID=3342349 RepID=UPI00384F2ADD